jgi:uncharacterized protein
MKYFFDSSALVKRYIEEEGRDKVNSLIEEGQRIIVSRLAYPEVLSALNRRKPSFDAADEEVTSRIEAFRDDWRGLVVFDMNDDTLGQLDYVIENHKLRGADSIHLSTALWIKKTLISDVVFVASDRELLNAAHKERFKIINPQDSSCCNLLR